MEIQSTAQQEQRGPLENADLKRSELSQQELIGLVDRNMGRVKADFGTEVAAIISPYIRQKAFIERDLSITSPEKAAYSELREMISEIGERKELHIDNSSLRSLLRDVHANLQEKHIGDFQSPIILVCTICPDYEFDRSARTYKAKGELGSEAGLSATTTLRKITPLLKIFSEHDIAVQLNLSYADIEAQDQSMLQKVGLKPEEFLARVAGSRLNAEALADRFFRRLGVRCGIKATSMLELIAGADISGRAVHPKTANGIAGDRTGFYKRFFADELKKYQYPQDFFLKRANKDISDHLVVGEALGKRRKDDERVSLVTLSKPVLANLFNSGITDQKARVPVIRLEQSY